MLNGGLCNGASLKEGKDALFIGIYGIAEYEKRSAKHRRFSCSLCDWQWRNSPLFVVVRSPFHIARAKRLQSVASF